MAAFKEYKEACTRVCARVYEREREREIVIVFTRDRGGTANFTSER